MEAAMKPAIGTRSNHMIHPYPKVHGDVNGAPTETASSMTD
jgi:hypothetical protein